MNNLRGVLYAVVSSATFGLIPLFSIPLLQGGMSSPAILFYRFGLAANRHAVASGCDVFRDGPRAVAFLHLHSQQCGHDDQLSIPAGRGDRDDAVFPRKKFRLAAGCDPHLTGGCGAAFVGRYRRSAERPCHRRRRVRGSDRADLHDLYRRCEKKPYFPARSDDPGFLCPAFQRLLLPRVRPVLRCPASGISGKTSCYWPWCRPSYPT